MTWFTGLMVFVILWFLVLFMVLPFGVKAPDEVSGFLPRNGFPRRRGATTRPSRKRCASRCGAG